MASKDSDNRFTSLSQEDMFADEEENKPKERAPKPNKQLQSACLKPLSKYNLPAVAVPEKILLVFDNSADESEDYRKKDPELDTETRPSAESTHQSVLRQFICLKMNQPSAKGTEIAFVTLCPSKIEWKGLTSDKLGLMKELSNIPPQENTKGDQIDITPIFKVISNIVNLPEQTEKNTPPEYIVRLILVYCNSYSSPVVNKEDVSYLKFARSPYFVLDVLYLHERQSNNNNVEQIFNQLSEFVSPSSYLLESSRNLTNVYNQMAKLLAHPNQRLPQSMWKF